MTYTAKSNRYIRVLDLEGNVIRNAAEACPEEGWLELWIMASAESKKVVIDRKTQQAAKVRVHTNFDLVDMRSDKVLHRVRWSMDIGKPELRHEAC